MKLSNRLTAIANMIGDNTKVYDIGCDHAYLDMYLVTYRKNVSCFAIDDKKSIIDNLSIKLRQIETNNHLNIMLNDGLNNLKVNKKDVVVLAGLGTKSILDIIDNKNVNNLIIQSNDDIFELRKRMQKKNYYVVDENIAFEKDRYYVVIKFKKGFKKYSNKKLFLGPKLLDKKDKLYCDYLNKRKNYYSCLLNTIPKNSLYQKFIIKLHLKYIKMALN